MATRFTEDDYTRNILDKIRSYPTNKGEINSGVLNEEKAPKSKAIAITDDPRFGERVLSNQIEQFRASVEGGAKFSTPETGKVSESPLIYIPETGNLVFSGVIPCLNNLKWQFVLRTSTGNGCFIWADGLILNRDNMQILSKLNGFYLNWKQQWQMESADLEKMVRGMQEND